VKECKFEAITVADNLSYIDWSKCRLCKKCVAACPTGAIVAKNFPAPKPVEPKAEETAPKPIEPKAEATEAAPQTIEPKDEAKEVTA
jgi:Fe-S-cluster-containing hydrogenase component 2